MGRGAPSSVGRGLVRGCSSVSGIFAFFVLNVVRIFVHFGFVVVRKMAPLT